MEQKIRKYLVSASLTLVLALSAGMLGGCAAGGSGNAGGASSAAAGGDAAGMATLQIVNVDEGGNPSVMVNKTFGFEDGATLAGLLDAAVAEGDLKSYELNEYEFIQSFTFADGSTVANAEDFSTYWAQYENSVYYAGQDTVVTAPLADGGVYQFGIETYQEGVESAPVDWAALDAPAAGNAVASAELAAAA